MEYADAILDEQISGFHQYRLEPPFSLTYVSRNLCRMLMAEDLTAEKYLDLVHPAHRDEYEDFLLKLSQGAACLTLQYRIRRADGEILWVSDTVHTSRSPDGAAIGSSVLTDITALKTENRELHFLSDTVPCGFLKYTCEKQPKLTYINERMLSLLRFPEDEDEREELLEFYRENIYALIPMEERRRMGQYLERVHASSVPIAGEVTVLRCDGTKAHLFGWVAKVADGEGESFQSVCMDISERYHSQKAAEVDRYLSALHDVYDKIFQYDFSANTVTCLYGRNSAMFRWIERVPMQMQEATEKWVTDTVHPEDMEVVLSFFRAYFQRKRPAGQPPQIRYRARSSDGQIKNYLGLFLDIDSSVSLFCCRNLAASRESAALRSENASLKSINENMQELMMHFTDGIAAFEVDGDLATPLYASDNVCSFFGFPREQWLELMKKKTPIGQFVKSSGIAYEEFARVLTQGEAEFTYPDLSSGLTRRIKAICSQKGPGSGPRYVMLYDLDTPAQMDGPKIYIRTFGFFDVFVDEKPIAFRIQKAKELFALLVDRRGGYLSSDEAISYLWPEEPSSPVTLARYRKVALRLKSILEEYGIPHVVEAVDGKRRIAADRVECDLYNYLSGKPEHAQLFKGSYLSNYSWGETTLGELTCENLY